LADTFVMLAAGARSALGERLRGVATDFAVVPEERALAGSVSGAFFMIGGVTVVPLALLPGVTHAHAGVLYVIAAGAFLWGACSVWLIDWDRAPAFLIHLSVLAGLGVIAGAVASSGGSASPSGAYLFFVVVFAAYFWRPKVVAVYLVACVMTQALVLLYDPRATHAGYLAKLEIGFPSFIVAAWAISAGRTLLSQSRARAELLAAEQGALRRVATAVVEGDAAAQIYELVAREAAALLGGGAAGIIRFDGEEEATVMGSWADHEGGRYPPGTVIEVKPGSDVARARDTRSPVRIDDHPDGSPVRRLGYTASIIAPVKVGGRSWGALAVTAALPTRLTSSDEEQLQEFGDLLATAIASIDDRARLAAQAATDPLTGLSNRRTLHDRLAAEVARSLRHSRTLSVAVIDIDHFKEVNDFGGHDAGDEMLAGVARSLAENARAEDILGRVGGDEFAWVMPETTRERALVAVERARRMIAATVSRPFRITVSAGICDTNATTNPAELITFADAALYWSKAHGRDRCWIYDAEVITELSAPERVERLESSQALLGLRSLARAIDAKDPATRQHSERVATLAVKLARAAGWPSARAAQLSDTALVHDVGKVGVPDELLRKRGALTASERERVQEHAELGARIAEGVLGPEQVSWIRIHHERPDGSGYPRGLSENEIPEGAALLAVADAWDVMTSGRPYSGPKSVDDAVSECTRMVSRQFTKTAVGALLKLHAAGELDPTGQSTAHRASLASGGSAQTDDERTALSDGDGTALSGRE
jgi:diguanylate cyclase (GGDEF)-like protein